LSTITRADVDSLTKKRGEPDWLEKLRLSAFEAYFEADQPSIRLDDWRKTLVETVDLTGISQVSAEKTGTGKKNAKADYEKILTAVSGVVSQVNGVFAEQQLDEALAKKGVIFTTIEDAVTKHSDLLKRYLENGTDREIGKLSLMNSAFFTSGAFLYIPKNVVVDLPFVIVNTIAEDITVGQAIFPRVIVVADDGASAKVVNVFEGGNSSAQNGDGANLKPRGKRQWIFTSAIVDVVAKPASSLHYLELYNFGRQVFSVSRNNNHVSRDAVLYSFTAALGGGQLKSDIVTTLADRGAASDVRGIALADGQEHFYFNTVQNHDSPDTKSDINFRVALKGNAVSSYQGNIKVSLTASRTDAFQSNKNLLLSETAKAESIPRLEILTDDVKCSHGATVGPVDKNQLFYLMTRGLSEKEAEEFIVTGFFASLLASLKIEGAAAWIEELIGEKIHAPEQTKELSGARS
jgi:Fe-S cluster assembly protein SufD